MVDENKYSFTIIGNSKSKNNNDNFNFLNSEKQFH